jgi:uncharacterized protein YukE
MGKQLDDIVRRLDQGVGTARATHWQGPSADAFAADWTLLKKSVDDALPVFELAAADLDAAADRVEESKGTATATPDDSPQESSQASTPPAYQAVYALTALSQVSAALGSVFGGGRASGSGGGRRTSPARTAASGSSSAPRAADPFGPPEVSEGRKERPGGGLGVARGVRTPGREPAARSPLDAPPEAAEAKGTREGATAGKTRQTSEPEPDQMDRASSLMPGRSAATAAPQRTPAAGAQSQPNAGPSAGTANNAADKAGSADKAGLDTDRHGAFG